MDIKKQNILFLTRTMGLGGTENVILQLCEIFQPLANKLIVCSSGGVNIEKLNSMGIHHYTIPDISQKSPIIMLKTYKYIHSIIKKEGITVVHSHHRMAAFYTELVTSKSVLKIANAHNTFQNKKKLTKFAYKNTNIIAVGKNVKDNLTTYFEIPEHQIKIIRNSVKPFCGAIEPFDDLTQARIEGYTLIGNIGRLSKQKGIRYFIDAAEKVHKSCPKTKFYIIGDGEDREKLMSLVRSKGMEREILFLGYHSDIQNIMSQLDFIVLTSLWEGFPLTPIEAFSVGKTIIATAIEGTSEIVQDGVNGYLVAPKDVETFAEKMSLLISNSKKREKLEHQAKICYKKHYSFENLKQKYINYYEGLQI